MSTLRVWWSRVSGLFRRSARDRALDDELQAHLGDLTDELVDRGMSRAEAVAEARRQFGGIDQVKASYRDQRGWPAVDGLRQDVAFALRQLRSQRASTTLAVLCLALGMGVSMAFFTIVNAHCLRGLPITQPERVLHIATRDRDGDASGLSYADFMALGADTSIFAGTAAYTSTSFSLADDERAAERVAGGYISAGGFELLGVQPHLGRDFDVADEVPGTPAVVIIGHDVWTSRYAGDPSVVGRSLRIDGTPATIVGVMPPRFRFPGQANAWLPLAGAPGLSREATTTRTLAAFSRLVDDVPGESVEGALATVSQRLAQMSPATNGEITLTAVPINERFNGRLTDPAWLAFLTAGLLVLLVACANVANLLLARVAVRSREVALRLAMGATRLRIVRQLLVESLVLAAMSGAAGLALAIASVRLLAWSVPSSAPLPYWIAYTVDARVLTVLLVTCMASVVVFGMVPAVHGARVSVNGLLKDGGRHGTATRRTQRLTATFMVAQIALATVLLAQVSTDLRSDFGPAGPGVALDDGPLMTAQIMLPPARYGSLEIRRRFFDQLEARINQIPGVAAMTLLGQLPPAGGAPMRLRLPDQSLGAGEQGERVFAAAIGPGYFETIGVSLSIGRDLDATDSEAGREAVVVSQHFADRTFPGLPALGERIGLVDDRAPDAEPIWRTIVGVAPDLRHGGPSPLPLVYLSSHAAPLTSAIVVVRSNADPITVGASLREIVSSLDPDLPVHRAVPLATVRYESSWVGRVSSGMLRSISAIALTLALVGLYAVTVHGVMQRRQEIGIRVALGARPAQIARMVLRRAATWAGLGLVAGLPVTLLFDRAFPAPATGPTSTDLVNLLLVTGVMMTVAFIASAWPAMIAARVLPTTIARSE